MDAKFEELKGKTIIKIEGMEKDSVCVKFFCSDGNKYVMDHRQDCCESVYLEDVCGDVKDLLNSPVLVAEEVQSTDEPALNEYEESWTWTFYKLATSKGTVTLRWYGASNGYYSEEVNFHKEFIDLKPCPFCGSTFIRTARVGNNGEYASWCGICMAKGPLKFRRSEAIEAWNLRAGE